MTMNRDLELLIRTRDSKAHVEMSKAEASQAEAAPVGA
jgi:hypothetical protein